jgi:SAM-dependent methyltransferase
MLRDHERLGSLPKLLGHVRESRRRLSSTIDLRTQFETWEETCVPSYCHPNIAAAGVSWLRLVRALALAESLHGVGPVLDFGAATGELGKLLDPRVEYHFIEQDPGAAAYLARQLPRAIRHSLDDAPDGHFGCVFALDSLEHNDDYAELLDRLARKVRRDGVLIVSGPTESALYRLGRRIAGFSAHYHKTTIREIELAADGLMLRLATTAIPFNGGALFRISAWKPRAVA